MLNNWNNLKQHFLVLVAGLCTSTAVAQPCTQLLIASYTPGNVCTGRSLNLSANTISGASYSWTGPAGFFSTGQNPIVPSVAVNNTGAYIVTATAGSCIYKDTVNVVANITPATPVLTANNPPCKGGNLALGISGPTGTTFALYNPSGVLMSSQTIINLSSSHNGTYKAVATSIANGCKSDTSYYSVQVIDLPAPILLADASICRGDTLHMYVMNNTPSVDNYYWNTPTFSPFYTAPTPLHLPNVTNAGVYTVRTVFDGCMSPVASTLVTFKPSVFATTTVTADGEIQSGFTEMTFTAHISNGGGSPTIQWFKNGAPIPGAINTTYKGIMFSDIFPMDWFYAQVQRDSACGGINYSDTIQMNEVLNVQNVGESNDLTLYPNPNTGQFTLQIPSLNETATIEIINSVGQRSFMTTIDRAGTLDITLPPGLANGMYTLRLTGDDKAYVTRFTVYK
ncbi:T9SS type A sorting domain-containing protein [Polluticoccus soli]|uniref:T9SS type A sorting domain-containing protein n=1 Tax=Polluticoccus soli TaxID=3034150 RepID=UPI0023E278B7|nr:T9SS type A sorting domain-containing protein [Flavipsychrobacter sp. JY13-12]